MSTLLIIHEKICLFIQGQVNAQSEFKLVKHNLYYLLQNKRVHPRKLGLLKIQHDYMSKRKKVVYDILYSCEMFSMCASFSKDIFDCIMSRDVYIQMLQTFENFCKFLLFFFLFLRCCYCICTSSEFSEIKCDSHTQRMSTDDGSFNGKL